MGRVVTRINDNLISLSDNLRIKFITIVLNCSDPWESSDHTLKVINRVLRYRIRLEYVTDSTKNVSMSGIELGAYELLRLEELIPNLFLSSWFKNCFTRKEEGGFKLKKKEEFNIVSQSGDIIGFVSAVNSEGERGVIIQTNAFKGFVNEYKLYELLFFVKKFDPYTYANITALGIKILYPMIQQNNKSGSFFKQEPKPVTEPTPVNKRGRMIGERGGGNII